MHLGPERLRVVIADALAGGTFVVCHDALTYGNFPDYGPAICRGFFDAHAGRSSPLIFLQTFRRLTEVRRPARARLMLAAPGRPAAWDGRPLRRCPDGSGPDAASTRQASEKCRHLYHRPGGQADGCRCRGI
jgi:hypothetical protein